MGKPFAGIADPSKRSLFQEERLRAIGRIGEAVRSKRAEFVLVAGDLFDSRTPTRDCVVATCSEIGKLGVPVHVIPGNHDHGGAGGVWGQEFFQRERSSLSPNLQVYLEAQPVLLPSCVLFPCPLRRRAEAGDPTHWLRSGEAWSIAGSRPRIVLAHGSVQGFSAQANDEEEEAVGMGNLIDLRRLDPVHYDYVALGDWHGTKQVASKAWYSGTPETDRFPKGEGNQPGNLLLVEVARGGDPLTETLRTGRLGWHQEALPFNGDGDLPLLEDLLCRLLGTRSREDLLRLELAGSLGIAASAQLEQRLESLAARLLRLKLYNKVRIAPSPEEMSALAGRVQDPLIARVATLLIERTQAADEEAATIARLALRELHTACVAD